MPGKGFATGEACPPANTVAAIRVHDKSDDGRYEYDDDDMMVIILLCDLLVADGKTSRFCWEMYCTRGM